MLAQKLYQSLLQLLTTSTGKPVHSFRYEPVSGGSINQCYRINTADDSFFCKVNRHAAFPGLFEKEMLGLQLLSAPGVIGTPKVIAYTVTDPYQLLLLEYIEPGHPDPSFWKNFGMRMARLHQESSTHFGLDHNNYMGSIPQNNHTHERWTDFFVEQRLQPMVEQSMRQNLLQPGHVILFENIYRRIENIFMKEDRPSLLHGDLWSGNYMCSKNREPFLVDPAVYYGHRSIDLAMTTLFGGFDKKFYEAYQHHYPMPSNYQEQWKVCNLYPLLIHLLLFGKSYLRSIETTLHEFA